MKFNVAIVGGGVAGASLARALSLQSDLNVALVEPRPPKPLPESGFDARVYALNARSRRLLEEIGVWQQMAPARMAPIFRMQVFGDDASAIDFDAYQSHVKDLATIVEEASLLQGLHAAMRGQDNLAVIASGCTGATWSDAGSTLALADGSHVEADLVVAADGADSALRNWAGIDTDVRDYGQSGVVANFRVAKPHLGTAYQWFSEDGVLALLPLPGDNVSMVWSAPDALADALMAEDAAGLSNRVELASHSRLGALEQIGTTARFPLRRMRAARLIGRRLALVGDTAHNVHPLAGQGLNLGLADVGALAAVLSSRGMESDCGAHSLLRQYERRRREEVLAMEAVTHGLHGLFGTTAPGAKRLRNTGLNLVNRMSLVKRLLVKHAMG